MTTAGSTLGRTARWVWYARGPTVAVARLLLLAPAALYRVAVLVRNAAYDAGVLRSARLPAPSVGVGNLAVGGVGKTPVARFLAVELARRGCRVGVLLRDYGDDEVREHREALPAAVVVFPLSYIFGDILTEVYGYRMARRVIWLGFLCNLIYVAFSWIGQQLPAAHPRGARRSRQPTSASSASRLTSCWPPSRPIWWASSLTPLSWRR